MTSPSQMQPATPIDPRAFRETLGHYPSGITIIAGHDGVRPIGFTCQSFYSVSLEPPLISFSVMKTSTSYPPIRDVGRFSVNVLARSQTAISNQFARSGTEKWAGVAWTPSRAGSPLILGSLMWLDCTLHAEYEAGDHYIVVGRVHETGEHAADDAVPLLYYRGRYRQLGEDVA